VLAAVAADAWGARRSTRRRSVAVAGP